MQINDHYLHLISLFAYLFPRIKLRFQNIVSAFRYLALFYFIQPQHSFSSHDSLFCALRDSSPNLLIIPPPLFIIDFWPFLYFAIQILPPLD